MWKFLYKLASPQYFYNFSGQWLPWLKIISMLLFIAGIVSGLYLAPADYQQGDAFRIIYIHVPSAFLSLMIYSIMSFCAVLIIVWRIKLAEIILQCSVPLGAWMTVIALITGSIWGKPMWGTWWIWDARLTSELILLFLYLGVAALLNAIQERVTASRAAAIMVLVGFVDIPIIHYSVYWWNTLHQGATISLLAKPTIAPQMLYPLLVMIAAFITYFIWQLFFRARNELLAREKQASWVKQLIVGDASCHS